MELFDHGLERLGHLARVVTGAAARGAELGVDLVDPWTGRYVGLLSQRGEHSER
jgi:hypothetical protein